MRASWRELDVLKVLRGSGREEKVAWRLYLHASIESVVSNVEIELDYNSWESSQQIPRGHE